MDGNRFDRITRSLVARLPRRDAVRALASAGLATLATRIGLEETIAGKKKRCRKRRRNCGGKKKCCGKNTACRNFPTPTCTTLSGRRCCGLEGAPCNNDPNINNCDCCDGLFCGGIQGEPGRCQEEPS
jgi:hypothetical protein